MVNKVTCTIAILDVSVEAVLTRRLHRAQCTGWYIIGILAITWTHRPKFFQRIEFTRFFRHDMHDNIAKINQYPLT